MRIVGLLFLSALPILWGGDLYCAMKRRLESLSAFSKFVLFVREQIRFSGREVDEVLSLALREPPFLSPIFEEMARDRRTETPLTDRLLTLRNTGLKKRDVRLITEFYEGLGRDDLKGQLAHCDYYQGRFEKETDEANQTLKQKGRLTVSLSLAAAAALFILML